MPCYTVREQSVALEVANHDVLVAALKAAGYRLRRQEQGYIYGQTPEGVTFTIANGELTLTGEYVTEAQAQKTAAGVKVAYAHEAVKVMTKKYGWQTTATKTKTPNVVASFVGAKKGF